MVDPGITPGAGSRQAAQPAYLLAPDGLVDGLEDKRDAVETVVVHDVVEHRLAEVALPQAVVTVDPTTEGTLGAVDMHPLEVLEPHDAVEVGKHRLAPLGVRRS